MSLSTYINASFDSKLLLATAFCQKSMLSITQLMTSAPLGIIIKPKLVRAGTNTRSQSPAHSFYKIGNRPHWKIQLLAQSPVVAQLEPKTLRLQTPRTLLFPWPTGERQIYPSLHPSIHPSIYSFILPLIHPCIHSCMHASVPPTIHSSFHPSIYPFIQETFAECPPHARHCSSIEATTENKTSQVPVLRELPLQGMKRVQIHTYLRRKRG